MLKLKNNENFYDISIDEFCEELNNILKFEGFFFRQHPLVKKSPPATTRQLYNK